VSTVVTPAVGAMTSGMLVRTIFWACVSICRERDKAESPGGIQGGIFFLRDVVKALKPSRVTNAGKGRDVECRLDQVFSRGSRHN
jgi:hypothetical protein